MMKTVFVGLCAAVLALTGCSAQEGDPITDTPSSSPSSQTPSPTETTASEVAMDDPATVSEWRAGQEETLLYLGDAKSSWEEGVCTMEEMKAGDFMCAGAGFRLKSSMELAVAAWDSRFTPGNETYIESIPDGLKLDIEGSTEQMVRVENMMTWLDTACKTPGDTCADIVESALEAIEKAQSSLEAWQ